MKQMSLLDVPQEQEPLRNSIKTLEERSLSCLSVCVSVRDVNASMKAETRLQRVHLQLFINI